jgi:protease-4
MTDKSEFDFSADRPQPAGSIPPSGVGPARSADVPWERSVLERLAFGALAEQRRARRWGIFWKLLAFGYLTVLIGLSFDWTWVSRTSEAHTALVDLAGVIEARGAVNADQVIDALQHAFKDPGTQGVILRLNSPGGSPVQSGLIYDEIVRLRALYPKIPLYAVVEDVCASGCYYIAAAADRIFVDKASLVGSIGVLMDGFGFTGTMEKLGVERRLLTAGENKGFLDPFSPLNDAQRAFAHRMLEQIHQQFIAAVKKGRGARLKESPELFSGLVWSGAESMDLGLADALGSMDGVAREVIKAETIVDYTEKGNFAERLAKRLGASFGQSLGTLQPGSVHLR